MIRADRYLEKIRRRCRAPGEPSGPPSESRNQMVTGEVKGRKKSSLGDRLGQKTDGIGHLGVTPVCDGSYTHAISRVFHQQGGQTDGNRKRDERIHH